MVVALPCDGNIQRKDIYISCLKLNLTYLRTPFLTDLFFHMCRLVLQFVQCLCILFLFYLTVLCLHDMFLL